MNSYPSGTVTFLFTDIEGSTKLARVHADKWESVRARHNVVLKTAIELHKGFIFQIIGDAFCVAFHTVVAALNAAVEVQRGLQREDWGGLIIKVRMGLHTGSAELHDNDYRGYLTMARVQRIMSVAYGGQVLLSNISAELLNNELPKEISLHDLKEHRLKGLPEPERLWQLVAPDLQQDFPPLSSLSKIPNNLPLQLTTFVGREKEINQIKKRLKKNRLITLTGVGGIGKTRLAIQTASALLNEFSDGTWLVELAPLADPALVPQTIANTLGLIEQAGRAPEMVLTHFLQGKNLLLILDNCEHLTQACAGLAETLLQNCPDLHIVVTSREALGISGEIIYLVPSLSKPSLSHLVPDTLSQYEAARLFMERALLAQSQFTLTNENASAVAEICHRLDGIPLAIELAAARLRTLSPTQICSRLDDRFRLLTGGSRTALPRQQTLRAMIDWSYDLLSENEKRLLRRLAVFVGGWSLELAEQICSDDKIDLYQILDMLGYLVDKSLVAVDEDKIGTRYRILETVRQYAREKLLESGEGTTMRTRHRDVFLEFVEKIEPELIRGQQKKWMDVLEAEHDNLRAALNWSLENEHTEQALRFCSALFNFWSRRKHLVEATQVCRETLTCAQHREDLKTTTWYASGLLASAIFASDTEKKPLSDPFIRSLLEQARQIYDTSNAYNSIGAVLASLLLVRADLDLNGFAWAEQCHSDLYAKVNTAGYQYGLALVKRFMALLANGKADDVSEMTLWQESSEMFMQLEDVWEVQYVSLVLMWKTTMRGEFEDALKLVNQNLLFFEDYGDPNGVAACYNVLGTIARDQGRYEAAQRYYTDAAALDAEAGLRWGSVFMAERLAFLHYCEGKLTEARAEYRAILVQLQDVPTAFEFGFFHARAALVSLREHRFEEAHQMLAVALNGLQRTAPETDIYAAYYGLGELARLEGNYPEAIENYLASLKALNMGQVYIGFPYTLNGLAKTGLMQSKFEYAARLFGVSEGFCKKTETVIYLVDRPDYDKHIEFLRAKMNPDELASAWAKGHAMTIEQAIDFVLGEKDK